MNSILSTRTYQNPFDPVIFGKATTPCWVKMVIVTDTGHGYTSTSCFLALNPEPEERAEYPSILFGAAQTPTSQHGRDD